MDDLESEMEPAKHDGRDGYESHDEAICFFCRPFNSKVKPLCGKNHFPEG